MIKKRISGYEDYEITDCGRVFKGEMEMRVHPNPSGYLCVGLTKDGYKKKFLVHRLVGLAFIDNPESKPCINHKDFDKENNRVDNLEWVTPKENMEHAREGERITYKKGLDHYSSFFSESDILRVFSDERNIEVIAIDEGVSVSLVRGIKNGKAYSEITGKQEDCKKRDKISPEQMEYILKSEKGCTTLGRELGVSKQRVAEIRRANDPKYKKQSGKKLKVTPDVMEDIRSLSVREVMKKHNISQSHVYRLRKEIGSDQPQSI